ncbi:MAG: 3-deoxy-D-manno-octulosonic acid transferase [Deltaproteobacteria bacterium]|nr:3-deoxy-D-manno-octulosonic acid transferase [Deltaproteobacteria bacterium]
MKFNLVRILVMANDILRVLYRGVVKVGIIASRLRALQDKQWAKGMEDRLGAGRWEQLTATDLVWIHCASVGELNGIIPLLTELKEILPAQKVLLTTTSITGQAEIEKKSLSPHHCLLPFDSYSVVKKIVKRIKPRLFVVSETELWPNLIERLAKEKVPLMLINGRISNYSFPRYRWARNYFAPLLNRFAHLLVQTEVDKERFLAIGASADKIVRAGCTKYDKPAPQFSAAELTKVKQEFGMSSEQVTFVAGSVRPGEEKIVIETFKALLDKHKNFQMIIAPRHADQYEPICEMLKSYGLNIHRRSNGPVVGSVDVLLLDTMGELAKTYALCDFAFVGGSLVDIGGHNPFESAAYGKPVVMGKYVNNVREIALDLQQQGGMQIVQDASAYVAAIEKLLTDEEYRQSAGAKALTVWQKHQGATKQVCAIIKSYLE